MKYDEGREPAARQLQALEYVDANISMSGDESQNRLFLKHKCPTLPTNTRDVFFSSDSSLCDGEPTLMHSHPSPTP